MTILYVDDDEDDRELFNEAVKSLNSPVSCLTAQDGQVALEILSAMMKDGRLPQYIFLDVNMPVMDGRRCLLELKADYRFCHIPVIIYSTSGNSKDVQEFKRLGAQQYLIKHNGFRELIESLSAIIF